MNFGQELRENQHDISLYIKGELALAGVLFVRCSRGSAHHCEGIAMSAVFGTSAWMPSPVL